VSDGSTSPSPIFSRASCNTYSVAPGVRGQNPAVAVFVDARRSSNSSGIKYSSVRPAEAGSHFDPHLAGLFLDNIARFLANPERYQDGPAAEPGKAPLAEPVCM